MSETLPDRAKRLRNATGLSQEKLAAKAGVSSSAVARLEQGKGTPDMSTVEAVARALGVTTAELLGEAAVARPDGGACPSLLGFLERHGESMRVNADERAWLTRPLPGDRDIGDDEWWMAQLVSFRQQMRLHASGGSRPEAERALAPRARVS